MGGKGVFRAEVAQGGLDRGIGHKKASRVVKHREAMVIGCLPIIPVARFYGPVTKIYLPDLFIHLLISRSIFSRLNGGWPVSGQNNKAFSSTNPAILVASNLPELF
jgi:hypothetical protein